MLLRYAGMTRRQGELAMSSKIISLFDEEAKRAEDLAARVFSL